MDNIYRKKPVLVEAFQMTPERRTNNIDWPEWMNRAWNQDRGTPGSLYPTTEGSGSGTISIGTLEGELLVSWGDWIIRGIKGEIYPCKPDIFEATYEVADQPFTPPEASIIPVALAVLGDAFEKDPAAMNALLCNRVPCNNDLAEHPTIQTEKMPLKIEQYAVGMLGVLNGILSIYCGDVIASRWSEEVDAKGRRTLIGFRRYIKPRSEEA